MNMSFSILLLFLSLIFLSVLFFDPLFLCLATMPWLCNNNSFFLFLYFFQRINSFFTVPQHIPQMNIVYAGYHAQAEFTFQAILSIKKSRKLFLVEVLIEIFHLTPVWLAWDTPFCIVWAKFDVQRQFVYREESKWGSVSWLRIGVLNKWYKMTLPVKWPLSRA